MSGIELTHSELFEEIAIAAFIDNHGLKYRSGIFGKVSPSGELQVPYRPTQLVNCLSFLIEAASGNVTIPDATQVAVDEYIDLLNDARNTRDG